MKPVNQTKFSLFYADGSRLNYGNCLIACVASILEERIDEVPNVYTFYGLDDNSTPMEDKYWFKTLNTWLKLKHNKTFQRNDLDVISNVEYVIMRGLSMRGKPHCCIYKNNNGYYSPYFDPHPTSQYLSETHYYFTIEND